MKPNRDRTFITVDAPRASLGETVMVRNYRKRPAVFELGSVLFMDFLVCVGLPGHWRYAVQLRRCDVRLYVGDDGLKPLQLPSAKGRVERAHRRQTTGGAR
jgi:hypothetical protein